MVESRGPRAESHARGISRAAAQARSASSGSDHPGRDGGQGTRALPLQGESTVPGRGPLATSSGLRCHAAADRLPSALARPAGESRIISALPLRLQEASFPARPPPWPRDPRAARAAAGRRPRERRCSCRVGLGKWRAGRERKKAPWPRDTHALPRDDAHAPSLLDHPAGAAGAEQPPGRPGLGGLACLHHQKKKTQKPAATSPCPVACKNRSIDGVATGPRGRLPKHARLGTRPRSSPSSSPRGMLKGEPNKDMHFDEAGPPSEAPGGPARHAKKGVRGLLSSE